MTEPILFSGSPIDRADHQRRDADWLARHLERDESRFLVLWRLNVLVARGESPRIAWARGAVREWMSGEVGAVLLGLRDGVAHFAVDVSALEEPERALEVAGEARFADVRSVAAQMPADEAAIVAYARSRVDWHARHTHCSTCGGQTRACGGGSHRACGVCDAQHFPRADPVAIAVVARDDRCLLGRQRGWPEGLFSALAGFIESGETIEEAVRREVAEETGVQVGAVRYVASQPWPFPSSLMIGCLAEALDEEITIDRVELEDARWFPRETVRRALDGDGAGAGLTVPPPMAIANQLMRRWTKGESAE